VFVWVFYFVIVSNLVCLMVWIESLLGFDRYFGFGVLLGLGVLIGFNVV